MITMVADSAGLPLKSKRAVIFGASGGVGSGVAKVLAAKGAAVFFAPNINFEVSHVFVLPKHHNMSENSPRKASTTTSVGTIVDPYIGSSNLPKLSTRYAIDATINNPPTTFGMYPVS
jgi:NAD(P)-dependent dehydrogenase (short-subunit alcohol dehydrogenase family)